ncbi:putative metalloprotease CJM1_0395 family protein [Labrenzia sp. DG1229]|uniref:putative metalloprotease CJM1_0395 family protein n=1 Tax=Labrenzia sp. DG1229 TaxID=681847 RepID=UPI00068DD9CC|nr:putative metalloprotease CJM1_0395 family protein [Labrenzia sp. DG1229]
MIGALLSNTPANLLRSSGVAGEPEAGAEANASGRDRETARNSLASASVQSARRNNGPVLTSQAVLALQDAQETETRNQGNTSSGATGGEAEDSVEQGQAPVVGPNGSAAAQVANGGSPAQGGTGKKEDPDGDGLNEAEEKQVQELEKRDREVRAHEQAHARVGGAYAGAPSYTFQQGPDGKRYAIGGEVQIDTGKEKTPQETIRKMQIVIRAALAPAEPSSQDLKVAQLARSQLSEAQAESRQQKAEELEGDDDGRSATASGAQGSTNKPEGGADAATDPSGASDDKKSGHETRSVEAASAYQSAAQRASEAEALFASILA